MKESSRYILFITIFLGMASIGLAELKIGYIQSERIRTEYEEFTEAESQLQMEYQKVQVEYEGMLLQLDSLNKDYEVKRLMALDKGESIKQQMIQMERAIQVYQAEKVGPQGELMRKQAQMELSSILLSPLDHHYLGRSLHDQFRGYLVSYFSDLFSRS